MAVVLNYELLTAFLSTSLFIQICGIMPLKNLSFWSSCCGTAELAASLQHQDDAGPIPGLARWVKGSSVAAAAAWIQSLARELPHAVGVAIQNLKREMPTREKLHGFPSTRDQQAPPVCSDTHAPDFLRADPAAPAAPQFPARERVGGGTVYNHDPPGPSPQFIRVPSRSALPSHLPRPVPPFSVGDLFSGSRSQVAYWL